MTPGREVRKGISLSKEQQVADHLDDDVITWVNEHLSYDAREKFLAAYEAGNFTEAHAVLRRQADSFPWRAEQWDKWLTAKLTTA